MSNLQILNTTENEYVKTSSGSINYQHYDNRARNIRSESVWMFLKSLFTDKKFSSVDKSEECHVMTFNNLEKDQNHFSPFKEAA